jgi:hypothetical protein
MRRNEDISESTRRETGNGSQIEERLLDGGDRDPNAIEAAAEAAFVEDQQENPDHPSRRQRRLDRDHDIENPSHSQGI